MHVRAMHEGIQYEVEEVRDGEWQWSFTPPSGPQRIGRIVGEQQWAVIVAKRAIEVWRHMYEGAEPTWLPPEPITVH
ncbi:MAG: hypothetical protein QOF14_4395 [Hyphomicrobiales bacterium]|nr:hypothetical protein [Hyphomicrobiales bacterium]